MFSLLYYSCILPQGVTKVKDFFQHFSVFFLPFYGKIRLPETVKFVFIHMSLFWVQNIVQNPQYFMHIFILTFSLNHV